MHNSQSCRLRQPMENGIPRSWTESIPGLLLTLTFLHSPPQVLTTLRRCRFEPSTNFPEVTVSDPARGQPRNSIRRCTALLPISVQPSTSEHALPFRSRAVPFLPDWPYFSLMLDLSLLLHYKVSPRDFTALQMISSSQSLQPTELSRALRP